MALDKIHRSMLPEEVFFNGMKNKLINGNFDFWQRGSSITAAALIYTADRWLASVAGSSAVISSQAFPLGHTYIPGSPKNYLRTVVTSVAGVGNLAVIAQRIEDVKTFSGKTATLSFWAKADSVKNMAVEFYQVFGTGGSPSAGVFLPLVTLIGLTTSWKKYTITIDIPSVYGKVVGTGNNDNLTVQFWLDSGSNNNSRTNNLGQQSGTFDIARVQMEEGLVATEFEDRSISHETLLCQRYFNKTYPRWIPPGTYDNSCPLFCSTGTGVGAACINWQFNDMRAIPTVKLYNPTSGVLGTWERGAGGPITFITQTISDHNVSVINSVVTTDNTWHTGHITVDAEL